MHTIPVGIVTSFVLGIGVGGVLWCQTLLWSIADRVLDGATPLISPLLEFCRLLDSPVSTNAWLQGILYSSADPVHSSLPCLLPELRAASFSFPKMLYWRTCILFLLLVGWFDFVVRLYLVFLIGRHGVRVLDLLWWHSPWGVDWISPFLSASNFLSSGSICLSSCRLFHFA